MSRCWLQNFISDNDLQFWGSKTSNKNFIKTVVFLKELMEERNFFKYIRITRIQLIDMLNQLDLAYTYEFNNSCLHQFLVVDLNKQLYSLKFLPN